MLNVGYGVGSFVNQSKKAQGNAGDNAQLAFDKAGNGVRTGVELGAIGLGAYGVTKLAQNGAKVAEFTKGSAVVAKDAAEKFLPRIQDLSKGGAEKLKELIAKFKAGDFVKGGAEKLKDLSGKILPKAKNVVKCGIDAAKAATGKFLPVIKDLLTKGGTIIKAMPAPVKVAAGILAGLVLLGSANRDGKIEQQHEDKIRVRNAFEE